MTKRVFLMDDSAFALDLTRASLAETGIEVTCGRDLAGLQKLRTTESVDLVLMDVEMPEAFGDDIASWLVSDGLAAPVYLLSSLPDDQLARRAEECGATGYISKWKGIDGVIGRVREILGMPPSGRAVAPSILIEDFVSMAQGRVRRAEAALARGEASTVATEMHTLAGEAALLGLGDLAKSAAACRSAAHESVGATQLAVATACATALDAVTADVAAAAGRARVPMAQKQAKSSARLLLLDDSDFYRSALMGLLEDSGYEVVEVRRLSEARHRMREGRYDVAILDLHLEDGRGSELIPELREFAPSTRLLVLSGDDAGDVGADLVLSKSIEPEELLRKVQELISSASTPASPSLLPAS